MLTTGAPPRVWFALLLLCSPSPIRAQSASDRAAVDSSYDAASSTAAASSASLTSSSTSSTPKPSSTKVQATPAADSVCAFRTINYITHTLPQQCLKTSWSAPTQDATSTGQEAAEATPPGWAGVPWAIGEPAPDTANPTPSQDVTATLSAASDAALSSMVAASASADVDAEMETDSPLDNANFLSFEDWKQRNLAAAGQSPENVGQGRAAAPDRGRRRPVNINALDSLGEESEIELDFGGFGNAADEATGSDGATSGTVHKQESTKSQEGDNAVPTSFPLSKDAGKTCKERFNYASFDCAATVLKTNKQAKSTTAVLVENKDSYMLNECSADNKFVIVELCDDILVDTVVLANYEFFSSMFRHFRVSVSDRYPVKMDRWRTLATFEARNSRDIQPFLINEPQIWARYLRIEFLTHYGNEFYCPMSLLRVHGTTMMEQFRREEEEARGDDDFGEPIESAAADPVKTAAPIVEDGADSAEQNSSQQKPSNMHVEVDVEPDKADGVDRIATHSVTRSPESPNASGKAPTDSRGERSSSSHSDLTFVAKERRPSETASRDPVQGGSSASGSSSNARATQSVSTRHVRPTNSSTPPDARKQETSSSTTVVSSPAVKESVKNAAGTASDGTATGSSGKTPTAKAPTNSTSNGSHSQPRSSQTQPGPASPTTQESFFKSISKRLQQLEANSTLSLQYIEEQSRILRDAFMKVEKRQLSKTENFLNHLNNTVMQELKSYRAMYDQLWQSTILELESMKERQKTEISEIGTRLTLVADELVWQKRMAVVQSTLLLLCLGLVLFVRSGTLGSNQADMPIAQQLGNKYSHFFDSPPRSPQSSGLVRRRRTFRNMWRSDASAGLSEPGGQLSDGPTAVMSDADTDGRRSPINTGYLPPTPVTPAGVARQGSNTAASTPGKHEPNPSGLLTPSAEDDHDQDQGQDQDEQHDQDQRLEVLATQSGPATPRGSRDSRPSWEEVDRAVDMLRAEAQGMPTPSDVVPAARGPSSRGRRSPLRRSESYSGPDDDGGDGIGDMTSTSEGDEGVDNERARAEGLNVPG